MVTWPSGIAKWKKVGLHELVMAQDVKRVHRKVFCVCVCVCYVCVCVLLVVLCVCACMCAVFVTFLVVFDCVHLTESCCVVLY